MPEIVLRYFAVIALSISTCYFYNSPYDYKAWLAFFTSLSGFIAADVKAFRNANADRKQESPDHHLFKKLLTELPSKGSIGRVKNADQAAKIFSSDLKQFFDFLHEWNNADHEFQNKKIEAMRIELISHIEDYCNCSVTNRFPTNTPGLLSLASEWEQENPQRYYKVIEDLTTFSDRVFDTHQKIVRLGKELLGISSIQFEKKSWQLS
jgi:hypothetical protein